MGPRSGRQPLTPAPVLSVGEKPSESLGSEVMCFKQVSPDLRQIASAYVEETSKTASRDTFLRGPCRCAHLQAWEGLLCPAAVSFATLPFSPALALGLLEQPRSRLGLRVGAPYPGSWARPPMAERPSWNLGDLPGAGDGDGFGTSQCF